MSHSSPDKKDCPEVVCEKSDPLGTYKRFAQMDQQRMRFKDTEEIVDEESEYVKEEDVKENGYQMCPNSRESLGFFAWNFLHTMAIFYPTTPTPVEKTKMTNFFDSFATFYPCKDCAKHFQHEITKHPVQVEDNKSLSIWLCEQHNEVNRILGKMAFDCSFENLEKRWKTGYEHCKKK